MLQLLQPVYQPVVDLEDSSHVLHYEALARISGQLDGDAHVGLIRLAEEARFIDHLDLAMVERVLQETAFHDFGVAINVSPWTVEHAFHSLVVLLEQHRLVAPRLVWELTESLPPKDLRQISRFREVSFDYGCRFALDDFGRGWFTESLVRQLKPDYLKTDGCLVQRAMTQQCGAEFSRLLELVQPWQGRVIVEHVDDVAMLPVLRDAGIRFGQGYLFGTPAPLVGEVEGNRASDLASQALVML